ncbi:hypothetical protein ACUY3K_10590 [Corynebacterium uberis]|uniref:hypothetical protein n=1 Tax=Corynebacterium TaxID=1716 RepID=UPI001D0B4ED8|nr:MULTISPECIES: hypothetical protein [Corynebacterium]MCZ9309478.1 hypothetical protein [Corynebacterium sp. c6VSa_13]UDL73028.1 hypothetical protein LH391_07875 [Corynebacterium uberis]UDL76095.1 hypothetical protein LH393_01515 [Corynebacterium uberis]UDL78307.1 hypothetical protein LH394_01510 [Corynebacterium uberis]UDL80590.1 hypothetical protein LH392_01940 [Corynebacterium uberis]
MVGGEDRSVALAVLLGVIKAVVGAVIVVAGIAASEHFGPWMDRWGYVAVMVVFMAVMMVGGALLAGGVGGVWALVRNPGK